MFFKIRFFHHCTRLNGKIRVRESALTISIDILNNCRFINASLPPSLGADGHFSVGKMSYGGSPEGASPPPTRATGGSDAQARFLGTMRRIDANRPGRTNPLDEVGRIYWMPIGTFLKNGRVRALI